MKLVWTEPAVHALGAIHDYIALDSEFYASDFVARIIQAAERLQDFSGIGRKVPEADRDDVQEILFQAYRIIYRRSPDRIEILTVVHGSRDLVKGRAPKPWEVG